VTQAPSPGPREVDEVPARARTPAAEPPRRRAPPAPVHVPAAEPTPVATPARVDDDLDDDDLGSAAFDEFDDDGDDGDFEGDTSGFGNLAPAPRPLPWRPIALGGGIVLVIGLFLFRERIFGPGDAGVSDGAAATSDLAAAGDPAAKSAPSREATPPAPADPVAPSNPASGEGQPVEPEDHADPQPSEPPPTATVAALLDPRTMTKLDEARDLYAQANGSRPKLQAARTLLDEVVAVAPDHPEALLILAQVQLEQGEMDASLASAQRCTQLAPEQADCWLTLGTIKQEKREATAAVDAYERYLALAPDGRYAGTIRKLLKHLK
jgi:hypothetical protein